MLKNVGLASMALCDSHSGSHCHSLATLALSDDGVQTFRRVPPVLPCNFCHPVYISNQHQSNKERKQLMDHAMIKSVLVCLWVFLSL